MEDVFAWVDYETYRDKYLITLEGEALIFSKKPGWVRILFGALGQMFADYKEKFRIPLSEVEFITLEDRKKKPPVIQLNTKTHGKCYIDFSEYNEIAKMLMDRFEENSEWVGKRYTIFQ